jgi:hypothetical protein
MLFGDSAADDLASLQGAAQAGGELSFAADITTALDLQKVVITSFRAAEEAGRPNQFTYEVWLAESPPLPPPAELDPFGGLGDFGLGDLGFDTPGLLDDLAGVAGDIAGAVNQALDVIDQLGALADLGGLNLDGGFMAPIGGAVSSVTDLAAGFGDAARGLGGLFGS